MKCSYCGKWIKPWHRFCTNCGEGRHGPDELKEEIVQRRKKLNAAFVYSKENVEKIFALNEALRNKMAELYDGAFEIQQLFLKLQEEGMKEFFEFKITGNFVARKKFKQTPVTDKRAIEIINFRFRNPDPDPQIEFCIDYNTTQFFGFDAKLKKDFIADVERQGVFANPAFENLKPCAALDIIFNKQNVFSLEDALYFSGDEWSIKYEIITAQHLWQRDEKLWTKRSFETKCDFCGMTSSGIKLPFHKYCPDCGNEMAMATLKRIATKHWEKFCDCRDCSINPYSGYNLKKKFDWNYENKKKVYELSDKINELYKTSFEEMFKMQKIFKEEFAAGKKYFKYFQIWAYAKYGNSKPFPLANKKTAKVLQEFLNENMLCSELGYIKEFETPECKLEHNAGVPSCGTIWNAEHFDKCFVGEHPMSYFMHEVFLQPNIYSGYTLFDIPYLKAEDFYVQYEIYLDEKKHLSTIEELKDEERLK